VDRWIDRSLSSRSAHHEHVACPSILRAVTIEFAVKGGGGSKKVACSYIPALMAKAGKSFFK
jgi:hypothetical protein